MALNNGLSQGSSFSDRVVGNNSGPVGASPANSTQPNGAMAFMLDGANLVDPGNQGTQIADINQDMTQEVKVLMSSYSAEYAKGPVVFQAISKSGGKNFRGEGYLYARNGIFNSIDSFQRSQGAKSVGEHYYYPGFNVGGPVLLPFTNFNRNRDKLFFWFGYEYMNQHPAAALQGYFVPTAEMRAGNFSPAYLHGSAIAKGVINGWEISGYTTVQSGAPLQPNTGGTLNVQWPSGVSNNSYLGTNAITLAPALVCDPRSNLQSGQYFNPSCFAPPAPGTNGSIIWPYIKGPKYFNSDLALFKNFRFSESRSVQFRISANNFLNHPNPQFNTNGNGDLSLNFNNNGTLSTTNINSITNGKPAYTVGNRLITLAVKFYF